MRAVPFRIQDKGGLLEVEVAATATRRDYRNKGEGVEPRSVLDNRTTPSPSSSLGGAGGAGGGGSTETAGVAAVSDNSNSNPHKWPDGKEDQWASELQLLGGSGSVDEWEAMLSHPGEEQTFLRRIMGGIENDDPTNKMFDGSSFGFGFQAAGSSVPAPVPPQPFPMFYGTVEEKPLLFNQQANQTQNPAPFLPLPQTDHHLINQNLIFPHQLYQQQQQRQRRPGEQKDENFAAASLAHHQHALVDQLFKAAELLEVGNFPGAREILARLNHQLPHFPLGLKPLLRSALYFREALHLISTNSISTPNPTSNHWDVVLKLNAYKSFSEVSPFPHFTNFTLTQTLLEELGNADRIHLVDFAIGIGSHWSSFMQELSHRPGPTIPVLKITAYVSPSSFHPLELHLTRQNLVNFAADLNIPFELNILGIKSFDPNELLSPAEAIGVNLLVGSDYDVSFPTLLRLVKQLGPKVVVSVEHGCDRSDLSFSHSFLHSFQSCMVLLDSIDAAGTDTDVAGKIERFLVQPRIEGSVIGRYRSVEKLHPWRALFASVGFVPAQFSNFTETQAECLLKRVQVKGFHVEKRHASLFLYWQRGELGSVSAWNC